MLFPFFYTNLIHPRSNTTDKRRQEFILNILLLSAIILSTIAAVKNQLTLWHALNTGSVYGGAPPYIMPWILLAFVSLFLLVRLGFIRGVSYVLIGILYTGAAATSYYWGVEVPQALITFVLVVVMSGVLVSTRFAFVTSTVVSGTMLLISYLHTRGIVEQNTLWKTAVFRFDDTVALAATIFVITVVSWLSNREIEKSLARAQASEAALKKERDSLEEKVEARTRELKQTQLEKMLHIYRFAEFGRRASGFFHDLVNPLNVVLLNLEELGRSSKQPSASHLASSTSALRRALDGARRIEQFVLAAQSHVQGRSHKTSFAIAQAIEQSVYIVSHKAKEAGVNISINNEVPNLMIYNEPIKFNQVVTNLVSNAIDSYHGATAATKEITVTLQRRGQNLELTIQDTGSGISPTDLPRIFEPLYTTKDPTKGVGLGLAITKDIVEKDFKGSIEVTSQLGHGTTFTVSIPLQ